MFTVEHIGVGSGGSQRDRGSGAANLTLLPERSKRLAQCPASPFALIGVTWGFSVRRSPPMSPASSDVKAAFHSDFGAVRGMAGNRHSPRASGRS